MSCSEMGSLKTETMASKLICLSETELCINKIIQVIVDSIKMGQTDTFNILIMRNLGKSHTIK